MLDDPLKRSRRGPGRNHAAAEKIMKSDDLTRSERKAQPSAEHGESGSADGEAEFLELMVEVALEWCAPGGLIERFPNLFKLERVSRRIRGSAWRKR